MIQCTYQKHLGFFKHHLDLYTAFAEKVADELIHPKPPGHVLIVWEQGEIFGLTRDQMIDFPMDPPFRALLDWHRGLLYEGTPLEWWSAIAWEEYVGHWCAQCRTAWQRQGYPESQLPYFILHEEADLQDHAEGVMPHGVFNRKVLEALLCDGMVAMRPGYSIPYCMHTSIDLFALMLDSCLASSVECGSQKKGSCG